MNRGIYNNIKWLPLLLILLLLGNRSAVAQNTTLTLQDCRDLALKFNKQLQASKSSVDAAKFTAKSYKANFFPNIKANAIGLYSGASLSYNSGEGQLPVFSTSSGQPVPTGEFAFFPGVALKLDIEGLFNGGVMLEQPIYMGGKVRNAYKMANIATQMALADKQRTENEVIFATDNAYTLAVQAQELYKVASSYKLLLDELLKNVESAHKHGLKPKSDVLKVKVKLNESLLAVKKAENAIRLAKMNLCYMIGKPLSSSVELENNIVVDLNELNAFITDISSRPEYVLLSKQVDLVNQQVKLSRSEMLPNVGLMGSYGYTYGLKLNDKNMFNNFNYAFMVNVSIPIFHFGAGRNKVKAAKAKLEQTIKNRDDLNLKMELELAQAVNNLDEAKLEYEISGIALNQAQESVSVSEGEYKAGLETLANLLEVQALWQQAYEQNVMAKFNLYLTYMAYKKACGTIANE